MPICPKCEDYSDLMERVNGPVVLQQIRAGKPFPFGYFKVFAYCPWCGHKLVVDPTDG